MLEDARQWPGFTDHEDAILQTLRADPKASLEAAYMKTVMPKLQADRTKVREEVLKEIKARPTTTSVPSASPTTPSTSRTTADIAREIMSKAR